MLNRPQLNRRLMNLAVLFVTTSSFHASSVSAAPIIKNLATGFDDAAGVKMRGNELDTDFALTAYSGSNAWPDFEPGENVTVFRPVTINSYLRDGASNGSAWVFPPFAPGINQHVQGIYTFETVFNVSGVDTRGVFVSGFRFLADNQLIGISVNREDVYVPRYDRSAQEFETWNELDNFGHGLFHSGINVIEYRFHNEDSSPSPMGFRLEGTVISGSSGDFDGDGMLSASDIDQLSLAILDGEDNPDFDLNNDGKVDLMDRSVWIEDMRRTWIGDANMDGEFNSGDMVEVFRAGKYESPQPATWAQGDWDGDRRFDSRDLIEAFKDGGFEMGPKTVVAIPEPSSAIMLIAALTGLAVRRRRPQMFRDQCVSVRR